MKKCSNPINRPRKRNGVYPKTSLYLGEALELLEGINKGVLAIYDCAWGRISEPSKKLGELIKCLKSEKEQRENEEVYNKRTEAEKEGPTIDEPTHQGDSPGPGGRRENPNRKT